MSSKGLSERVRALFEASRYQQRLGARFEHAGDGRAVVALAMRATNANRSGNLHGGAHASLMISAAMLAVASTEREPSESKAISVRGLSISYLGAARNVGVRAHGEVVRRGRDVAHVALRVDSDTGDVVATGAASLAIHQMGAPESSVTDSGGSRRAAMFGRVSIEDGRPVEGSPFLEESGLIVFDEFVDDWQSLLIPVAPNEDADGHIDDGAVVGLLDNCGSMAAYTTESVTRESIGATVSLSAVFASSAPGPVVGSGRLLSRLGTAFTSEVELWSPTDGSLRAAGLVCYRIPVVS